MTTENKEMSRALALKESGIGSLQQQLEEKSRECGVLSRQLQQTLDDAQKQVKHTSKPLKSVQAGTGRSYSCMLTLRSVDGLRPAGPEV